MTSATTTAPKAATGYRYVVVGLLAVVYTFNFMDRQILSTLAEPIRKDLNLSDTALGALGGLTFALFYTTFGIPVAWLSDRFKRVWIMAAACGIWSVFTAGCGLATNFTQLALSRMMVGIGEAGGSPPSYSLISDYFPAKERGAGLAIYSLGVPLGSMLGVALGAGVAAAHGWRVAFFVVGLPGVLLALIMLLVVREPKRGGLDEFALGADAHAPAPPAHRAIREFFSNRTLLFTAIACGLSAFVGYAMLNFNAPLLMRVKGMTLKEVSLYYSLVVGVTGAVGTFTSGWMADKLSQRDRRWYSWIPAIAFTLTIPALAGLIWAPTWPIALMFLAIPALLNNMYLAPALAVVQNAVSPGQRTMAGAILLFVLNLIGLGGGPLFLGHVSDMAKPRFGDHSLLIGYAALAPVIVIAIVAHLAAANSIARDKRLAAAL
ncbi:MFS transporter [Phenylobacterium sp.]|jgi:predicted MFS family arabinose efflux permease|uniref:spinster family MFS transporter n=1 Tax=Phenylobacterium sp. TaxID=1871053 RepID=UPI002E314F5B|nr:MFS transporter [Phenylobacterium sp.]HEX4713146.1 MFS transporter [Phenylobacterium sp.]